MSLPSLWDNGRAAAAAAIRSSGLFGSGDPAGLFFAGLDQANAADPAVSLLRPEGQPLGAKDMAVREEDEDDGSVEVEGRLMDAGRTEDEGGAAVDVTADAIGDMREAEDRTNADACWMAPVPPSTKGEHKVVQCPSAFMSDPLTLT